MKERPILFSGPMVRALLSGQKTQTRRVLKTQPVGAPYYGQASLNRSMTKPVFYAAWDDRAPDGSTMCVCPYGVVGDRLWVRESHWFFQDEHDPVTGYTPPVMTLKDVEYRADGESARHGWCPSIHMPRWASRISLEITGVRVERLRAISEGDARAEGVDYDPGEGGVFWVPGLGCASDYAADSFGLLWRQINGDDSWVANPWVWVIEFERASLADAATKEASQP